MAQRPPIPSDTSEHGEGRSRGNVLDMARKGFRPLVDESKIAPTVGSS